MLKTARRIQVWIDLKLTGAIRGHCSPLRGTRWTQASKLETQWPDIWAIFIQLKINNPQRLCLLSIWILVVLALFKTMHWKGEMDLIFHLISELSRRIQVEHSLVSKNLRWIERREMLLIISQEKKERDNILKSTRKIMKGRKPSDLKRNWSLLTMSSNRGASNIS